MCLNSDLSNMEITNVKIHFHIDSSKRHCINKSLIQITKSFPSFIILRHLHLVFTCFYSGFINITGIKDLTYIEEAKLILANILSIKISDFNNEIIDNISAKWVGLGKKNIILTLLISYIKKDSLVKSYKYNREKFPALVIKLLAGTIIWFPTNTIYSVGAKTKNDLNLLAIFINKYERMLWVYSL